ncbi:hypothetical protein AMELA_G00260640 [Ameiurus melas]|uniref:Uncharacterized protein n=1 Tax=Ameiurus melas TaxID=219545 RepID=A0A7J5ZRF0_AMEME|nr:hypothetical protein AMELA_G00260640 [Ameiurus melas]
MLLVLSVIGSSAKLARFSVYALLSALAICPDTSTETSTGMLGDDAEMKTKRHSNQTTMIAMTTLTHPHATTWTAATMTTLLSNTSLTTSLLHFHFPSFPAPNKIKSILTTSPASVCAFLLLL